MSTWVSSVSGGGPEAQAESPMALVSASRVPPRLTVFTGCAGFKVREDSRRPADAGRLLTASSEVQLERQLRVAWRLVGRVETELVVLTSADGSLVSVLGLAGTLIVQQVVDGQSHLRVGKAERSPPRDVRAHIVDPRGPAF